MPTLLPRGLVWLRRDLRLQDNPSLHAATAQCEAVWCVFVLDRTILDTLPRRDRRVEFILQSLRDLQAQLPAHSQLIVLEGDPAQAIPALAHSLQVGAVFTGRDYEPAAVQRDRAVEQALQQNGIRLVSLKDHVLWEQAELLTQAGTPFTVFTPYYKQWLARTLRQPQAPYQLEPAALQKLQGWDAQLHQAALSKHTALLHTGVPALAALGFESTNLSQLPIAPGEHGATQAWQDFVQRMPHYHTRRDFPAIKGPSYLSVHLRFGTIGIRTLVQEAVAQHLQGIEGASKWLAELAWRDFYAQILAHFPHVVQGAFRPVYDRITWESGATAETRWQAWTSGQTGYPLVDAAMRQLLHSGYMHNRLRMVSASFLVKQLGISWQRGEAFFAEHLLDFDLSANNGGWQWCSSSGCDAQPYFRIFNPINQSEKFDPNGTFIHRYVPELQGLDDKHIHSPWLAPHPPAHYPSPMVDLKVARTETLARYQIARASAPMNGATEVL
ncbi:deoxyribodipyrimidine photo-lyase [Curvibacter sp. CHRR-16]|uniref:cryptochrome/photolyase family protein n=1 Tax=Curvibacter sp. CHRR-16 TaxID=2835872 RepID=UPI001BDB5DF0|nr:deoxyribodipyrimidine photo-lyase [Curvibacter sp. CHRR-16]MBT0569868.1 deoxyribodipyrimidine photo-lyase [Curvibacter sp. CHRR-16]